MTKQRFLSTMALSMLVLAMTAAPVTRDDARQKAMMHLSSQRYGAGNMSRSPMNAQHLQLVVETPQLYGFDLADGQGFIVVSGDDRTPAILGYADSGSLVRGEMAPAMEAWLQWMGEEIAMLDEGAQPRAPYQAPRAPIAPMTSTQWTQHAPYNSQCPEYRGEDCKSGCVAVAMAQAMNYYRHPAATTKPIPAYTTTSAPIMTVAGKPVVTFDWDNMETEGAATLISYCGAALASNYSTEETVALADSLSSALVHYFDYDPSLRSIERSNYTVDEWDELAYQELAEGRVVIFSGVTGTGAGHSFVLDGYREDGTFHINWGWREGVSNGYYLLSVVDGRLDGITWRDGYTRYQSMILGMQPNTGRDLPADDRLTVRNLLLQSDSVVQRQPASGKFAGIELRLEPKNELPHTYIGKFGVGLFQGDSLLQVLYAYQNDVTFVLNNVKALNTTVAIGPDVADGDYQLKLLCCASGSDEWLPTIGSSLRHIDATIAGSSLVLRSPVVSLKVVALDYSAGSEENKNSELVVSIENQGTEYNGELFLFKNGSSVAGNGFFARPGEITKVNFHFRPEAGKTIKITTDIKGENVIYEGECPIPSGIADTEREGSASGVSVLYDLGGRQLSQPGKGIYIQNGRKKIAH